MADLSIRTLIHVYNISLKDSRVTVRLKILEILGCEDTWHSYCPASVSSAPFSWKNYNVFFRKIMRRKTFTSFFLSFNWNNSNVSSLENNERKYFYNYNFFSNLQLKQFKVFSRQIMKEKTFIIRFF